MSTLIGLIAFLLTIGLHEAGHYWAFRRFGIPVAKVSVGFGPSWCVWRSRNGAEWKIGPLLLGGYCEPVAKGWEESLTPRQGVVVAIAGPAANFALALACALIPSETWPESAFWAHFNFLMAAFNLLPIPPLDGGRVLYASVRAAVGDGPAFGFKKVAYPIGVLLVLVAQVAACTTGWPA